MSTPLSAASPESTWGEEGVNNRDVRITIAPEHRYEDVTGRRSRELFHGSVFPHSNHHTPTESIMDSKTGLLGLQRGRSEGGEEYNMPHAIAHSQGRELSRRIQNGEEIPIVNVGDGRQNRIINNSRSNSSPANFRTRSGSFGYPHFASKGNGTNRVPNEMHNHPVTQPRHHNRASIQDPKDGPLEAPHSNQNDDRSESRVCEIINYRDSQDNVIHTSNTISNLFVYTHGTERGRRDRCRQDGDKISVNNSAHHLSRIDERTRSRLVVDAPFVLEGNGEHQVLNEEDNHSVVQSRQNYGDPTDRPLVASCSDENSRKERTPRRILPFEKELNLNHDQSSPKKNHLHPSQMLTSQEASPTASPGFSCNMDGRLESQNSKQTPEADEHNLPQVHTPVNCSHRESPAFSTENNNQMRNSTHIPPVWPDSGAVEGASKKRERVKTEDCCVIQ